MRKTWAVMLGGAVVAGLAGAALAVTVGGGTTPGGDTTSHRAAPSTSADVGARPAVSLPVEPPAGPVTPITCPAFTGRPGADTFMQDHWTFSAYVSSTAGLVVTDLAYGPRRVADRLSLPYLRVVYPAGDTAAVGSIGHLSPMPIAADPDLASTLIGQPVCNPDGHAGVRARYQVRSASQHADFIVEQDYRFDGFDPDTVCEASRTAQCVRFWPTVTWARVGVGGDPRVGLDLVQRYDLDPDDLGTTALDVTRDYLDKVSSHVVPGIETLSRDGDLVRAGALVALDRGRVRKWENLHLSARGMVTLPGLPHTALLPVFPFVLPADPPVPHMSLGSGYAGCSDCVHAHWSWFHAASQLAVCHSFHCWSHAGPQLSDGSQQTACLAWRPASTDTEVADWCGLADEQYDAGTSAAVTDLEPHAPVALYWESRGTGETSPESGVSIGSSDYATGDVLWPQLPAGDVPSGSPAGDTGAMFVVPARRFGDDEHDRSSVEVGAPVRNEVAGTRLPVGWVVPVTITPASSGDQGPYYLRVRSRGLRVLNASGPGPGTQEDPWVDVYDDGPVPDPNATTGRVTSYADTPLHAFVVLDREPQPSDLLSLEVDAAPDGVAHYVSAAQSVSHAYAFQTPSGNIQCMDDLQLMASHPVGSPSVPLPPTRVVCRVLEATWRAPRCPDEPGHVVVLDAATGTALSSGCQGDTFTVFPGQGYPDTVASDLYHPRYGDHLDLNWATCDVEESGVTCEDSRTGHGFEVSREGRRTY